MVIVVARLKAAGGIHNVIQLPVRPDVACDAMPSLRTKCIARNRRELTDADTRRETHFVVKTVLDHCVRTAQLQYFVAVLHGRAAGKIFIRNARRDRFDNEPINGERLAKPEICVPSNASVI